MSNIKRQEKKTSSRLNPKMIRLIESVQKLRSQAKDLGIFTDDRELLECNECGLVEDVTANGMLMTYKRNSKIRQDSRLRFQEIGLRHFRCPQCKGIIETKEKDLIDG